MQISVNGQTYQRWDDVPADVRAQLLAVLPDQDANGVPDLFEGGGLPPASATMLNVNGTAYGSAADLPPAVLQALQQAGLGGFLGGTTTAPTASAAPDQPAHPAAGQMLLNGEVVDVHAAVGADQKRWWQFWK